MLMNNGPGRAITPLPGAHGWSITTTTASAHSRFVDW